MPTVSVPGHKEIKGVTNIVLDHIRAASLALNHLKQLGHERIAFLKGSVLSSDSEDRWNAICDVAQTIGLKIDSELVVQIDSEDSTPQVGYPIVKRLLARNRPFSALFAYNDISAIGAIRALREQGLSVPRDISVVGFDDIPSAAFNIPSLTTIRQPLVRMGRVAAQTLLDRIAGKNDYPAQIAIEPELIVRESTSKAPQG